MLYGIIAFWTSKQLQKCISKCTAAMLEQIYYTFRTLRSAYIWVSCMIWVLLTVLFCSLFLIYPTLLFLVYRYISSAEHYFFI